MVPAEMSFTTAPIGSVSRLNTKSTNSLLASANRTRFDLVLTSSLSEVLGAMGQVRVSDLDRVRCSTLLGFLWKERMVRKMERLHQFLKS
jgi:hypothetical protein